MPASTLLRNLLAIAAAIALLAGSAGTCFGEEAPVVSSIAMYDNGDGTATVTWNTNVPTLGAVNYGPVNLQGTTPCTVAETAAGTSHSVTITGIEAGTNYKIVIVNDGAEAQGRYWPKIWPIPGDVNQDCRVNILDLLVIRYIGTTQAMPGDPPPLIDVTEDGRLNILDLIYVRNRIGTVCPSGPRQDAPVVSSIAMYDNGDGTATVTWDTDIPALGAVNYGPVNLQGTTPYTVAETAAAISHSVVITGIAAGTNYRIVIVNDGTESPTIYWPPPYPQDCPGDASGDGRVNILDLIFVRGKLGQAADTGDNWKADVNRDGRINVLDLLVVRKNLNTICDP